jgi:hypothetical protein
MVGAKHLLELFQALSIKQWNDERGNSVVSVFPACVQLVIELLAFVVEIVPGQERKRWTSNATTNNNKKHKTRKALKIDKNTAENRRAREAPKTTTFHIRVRLRVGSGQGSHS